MILTNNEVKVLRLLATTTRDQSINEIAKTCNLSPRGAHKILSKLEEGGILKPKKVANIKSYKLELSSDKAMRVLELSFMPDMLKGRIRSRAEDLKILKEDTKVCIIFGSYITEKEKPSDIDVFFVLEKKNFQKYTQKLSKVRDRMPIKVQDVVQTQEDLEKNLAKEDPVVVQALRTGIVLWGADNLVEVIKNVHQRKA